MENKLNIISRYIISLISILVFVYLLSQNFSEFRKLEINFNYFIIFIITFLLRHITLTFLEWKMVVNLNDKVKFNEYLNENSLANLLNLTMPLKIGAGKKLLFLTSKYNIKTKDYFSIFTTLNIHLAIIFFTFFLFGLIFINLLSFKYIYLYVFLSLLTMYYLKRFKNIKFVKLIIVENYFSKVKNNLFWKNTNLIVISVFFGILQTHFLILSLFQFENLIGSLFINSATFFANIIQLSPGNLGFLELIYISLNDIINLNASEIVIFSTLNRLASIFIFLIFGIKKIK